jgi:hypothetical protein
MSVIAASQTARTPSCIYKNKLQKKRREKNKRYTSYGQFSFGTMGSTDLAC